MAMLGATAEAMPGELEYYVLKHGDQELCGIMQIDPTWGDFAPRWETYFLVASTDDAAAVVSRHGGTLLSRVEDTPFGRMVAAMDPDGATFKLIRPPRAKLRARARYNAGYPYLVRGRGTLFHRPTVH